MNQHSPLCAASTDYAYLKHSSDAMTCMEWEVGLLFMQHHADQLQTEYTSCELHKQLLTAMYETCQCGSLVVLQMRAPCCRR